jgi:hypothetical protein
VYEACAEDTEVVAESEWRVVGARGALRCGERQLLNKDSNSMCL